jgi:hypothetical protein
MRPASGTTYFFNYRSAAVADFPLLTEYLQKICEITVLATSIFEMLKRRSAHSD